jgi:hypothetical protein
LKDNGWAMNLNFGQNSMNFGQNFLNNGQNLKQGVQGSMVFKGFYGRNRAHAPAPSQGSCEEYPKAPSPVYRWHPDSSMCRASP